MNNEARLRRQSISLLSMLGVQFVLGMILNLFVTLPIARPGTSGTYWARAWHGIVWSLSNGGGIALLLHVLVAIGLLIGSILLVARAYRARNGSWEAMSTIGFIGISAALTNGLAFLGYNQATSSFVMAMGFMVAATAYSIGTTFVVPKTVSHATDTHGKSAAGRLHHSHN